MTHNARENSFLFYIGFEEEVGRGQGKGKNGEGGREEE